MWAVSVSNKDHLQMWSACFNSLLITIIAYINMPVPLKKYTDSMYK